MGKLRITCPKDEYLQIDTHLFELCRNILADEEIAEANKLSEDLTLTKRKKQSAILELKNLVGRRPKKPLYYVCDLHLRNLPKYTRDTVRYLGDYIDHLIKFLSDEQLNEEKHLTRSLGSNLRSLKGKIPNELHSRLTKYDILIYKPAKHDMLYKGRRHRFTAKEAVFVCFITMKLGEEIKHLSPRARAYAEIKK